MTAVILSNLIFFYELLNKWVSYLCFVFCSELMSIRGGKYLLIYFGDREKQVDIIRSIQNFFLFPSITFSSLCQFVSLPLQVLIIVSIYPSVCLLVYLPACLWSVTHTIRPRAETRARKFPRWLTKCPWLYSMAVIGWRSDGGCWWLYLWWWWSIIIMSVLLYVVFMMQNV